MTWNNQLITGNKEIDDQHRTLCEMIDRVKSAPTAYILSDALIFLITYVKEHFSAEEDLMLSHDFSGLSEHRSQHVMFVMTVQEYHEKWKAGTLTQTALVNSLTHWLTRHIQEKDIPAIRTLSKNSN